MRLLVFSTICLLLATSCSLEELRQDNVPPKKRAFSVEQAKEFFEKDFVGVLTRTQETQDKTIKFKGKLHPGDFTPIWDNILKKWNNCSGKLSLIEMRSFTNMENGEEELLLQMRLDPYQ